MRIRQPDIPLNPVRQNAQKSSSVWAKNIVLQYSTKHCHQRLEYQSVMFIVIDCSLGFTSWQVQRTTADL